MPSDKIGDQIGGRMGANQPSSSNAGDKVPDGPRAGIFFDPATTFEGVLAGSWTFANLRGVNWPVGKQISIGIVYETNSDGSLNLGRDITSVVADENGSFSLNGVEFNAYANQHEPQRNRTLVHVPIWLASGEGVARAFRLPVVD